MSVESAFSDIVSYSNNNLYFQYIIILTMKANEVLNLLRITRKTLHVYAATGKIRYTLII
jgi:hypothetical protein